MVLTAASTESLVGAQAVLYRWPATGTSGYSFCGIGDVNGDGTGDVLLGDPYDSTYGSAAGRALLRSGRDGSVLAELHGVAGELFGSGVTRLGDVDGDGVGDFAISAPLLATLPHTNLGGCVRVFSGASFALLYEVASPWVITRHFGAVLRPIADVDGDLVDDFIVGADSHYQWPGGAVALVSGASGVILRTWTSTASWFGSAVDAVGDYDGDGRPDVIVGALVGATGPNYAGSVQIFSSATGQLLTTISGTSEYDAFGISVAGLGDVDADGVSDFAIGCTGCSTPQLPANVYVHSGATASLLYAISDPNVYLGGSIEKLDDFDGDGVADFAVNAGNKFAAGYVRIVSGRSGATLQRLEGGMRFAYAWLGVAGDINVDGRSDLLLDVAHSSTAGGIHETRLVLLATDAPFSYCEPKLNSLGCEPAISSSGAASLSVGDNFVVSASNVLNAKPGVLLWSASPLSAPFAGGTLCVAPTPPTIRGPMLDSGGSPASVNNCSGSYAFHFSHALMQARGLTAGTTLFAQFLSRDPGFPPPRNVGLTDALSFTVLP